MWYYKLFKGTDSDVTQHYPNKEHILTVFASKSQQVLEEFDIPTEDEEESAFFKRSQDITWLGTLHTNGMAIIEFEQNDHICLELNDIRFIAKLYGLYNSRFDMTGKLLKVD